MEFSTQGRGEGVWGVHFPLIYWTRSTCSWYLPLSLTHSHCDDFTCKTANERARIPSLDQSQCLITVLSLRKVEAKTAWVWKWKLTLSGCTSSLLCWLPGDCWLSAGWWSFRLLMRLTPGLSEETVTDQIVCLSAAGCWFNPERVHGSNPVYYWWIFQFHLGDNY